MEKVIKNHYLKFTNFLNNNLKYSGFYYFILQNLINN